jgi:uncharacterized membrane protein YccF (DUF307 family)
MLNATRRAANFKMIPIAFAPFGREIVPVD